MRNEYPSRKWLTKFDEEFIIAGGDRINHTIREARETHAIPLYKLGATPAAAGYAAYQAYKLEAMINREREECSIQHLLITPELLSSIAWLQTAYDLCFYPIAKQALADLIEQLEETKMNRVLEKMT